MSKTKIEGGAASVAVHDQVAFASQPADAGRLQGPALEHGRLKPPALARGNREKEFVILASGHGHVCRITPVGAKPATGP